MKTETTIRGLLALSLITLSIVLFFFIENQRKFDEYKVTTKKEIDELIETQFQLSIEIGRHEMTREYVLPKYPNVKKEYEGHYEHETE
jgi:hypothetical protein